MNNEADRIESVIASVPQNATAAKVMGGGVHFEPNIKWTAGEQHWETCPPMRPVPIQPGSRDLTGLRVGRLTVMGLHVKRAHHGGRWVVRCSCGDFEVRRAKYLLDQEKVRDAMCRKCDYVHELPTRYKQLGPMSIAEIKQISTAGDQS